MPSEIILHRWSCDICGQTWVKFSDAMRCQENHPRVKNTKFIYGSGYKLPSRILIEYEDGMEQLFEANVVTGFKQK